MLVSYEGRKVVLQESVSRRVCWDITDLTSHDGSQVQRSDQVSPRVLTQNWFVVYQITKESILQTVRIHLSPLCSSIYHLSISYLLSYQTESNGRTRIRRIRTRTRTRGGGGVFEYHSKPIRFRVEGNEHQQCLREHSSPKSF